jgi:hypothetical protein
VHASAHHGASPPRQFTLENWAWVKLRNLPLSEPLQIANGTATDLTKLTIVLTLLASIQVSVVNRLLMASDDL